MRSWPRETCALSAFAVAAVLVGEPVLSHQRVQVSQDAPGVDREAVLFCGSKQVVHGNPPALPERQPDFLGSMSKIFRQVLAEFDTFRLHDSDFRKDGLWLLADSPHLF